MLRRQFFPTLRKPTLPKIRFHDLRHTNARLLINQGEHPKYSQNQLGHSSITMTVDVYSHLMKTVNQKAASKLGRAILGDSDANGSRMVAEEGRATDLGSVSILFCGTPGPTRTGDLRIRSPALYPLSYGRVIQITDFSIQITNTGLFRKILSTFFANPVSVCGKSFHSLSTFSTFLLRFKRPPYTTHICS